MTTNEPTLTLNDLVFGPDTIFSDPLEDAIIDLTLGRIDLDPKFSNLLRQVLSASKDEISRIDRGEQHDVTSFERVQIFTILSTLLLSGWIDTLPAKRRDRTQVQQRVLDVLVQADDVFAAVFTDVQTNHLDVWDATELPLHNLASKIWLHVYEVTAVECEQIANRFTAMLQAAISTEAATKATA